MGQHRLRQRLQRRQLPRRRLAAHRDTSNNVPEFASLALLCLGALTIWLHVVVAGVSCWQPVHQTRPRERVLFAHAPQARAFARPCFSVFGSRLMQNRCLLPCPRNLPSALQTDSPLAERVLACMMEAVIHADRQGLIALWNPAAETMFGFSTAEAIGQSLDIIIPERLREAHWRGFTPPSRAAGRA